MPRVDRHDVVLVHLLIVAGLKDAVRRVVAAATARREASLQREAAEKEGDVAKVVDEDDLVVELTDRVPEVKQLLQMLEIFFWHGLHSTGKSTSSSTASNPLLQVQAPASNEGSHFWDYLVALESANPTVFGASLMLVKMNAICSTPRGFCRAWLRQLLNQNALEFTLRALVKTIPTVGTKYYESWAFLRWTNEANRSMLFNLLGALNGIGFALNVSAEFLDGPPPRVPSTTLNAQSLVCAITIESALAASQSMEPNAMETILLVSAEDLEVSGRYTYVDLGLFANKVSGFQLRYAKDSPDGAGWGIYSPFQEKPLYFCQCELNANANAPPLENWRPANETKVLKSPVMVRLKFPAGLATRVFTKSCSNAVKEGLIHDEIKALRVEIRQIGFCRENLDVLRQMTAMEYASQYLSSADTMGSPNSNELVSYDDSEMDDVRAPMPTARDIEEKQIRIEAEKQDHQSNDSTGNGQAENEQGEAVTQADELESEEQSITSRNEDQALGKQTHLEIQVSENVATDENVVATDENVVATDENVVATDENVATDEIVATDEYENKDQRISVTTVDKMEVCLSNAISLSAPTADAGPDDSSEQGQSPATSGDDLSAFSSGDDESEKPENKTKKRRKRKQKLVKVASFGDEDDLCSVLTSRRQDHGKRRSVKRSSVVLATVFDTPLPTKVLTPKKELVHETEEERMQRYAREEEESLAQFIAEQEQGIQDQSQDQDERSTGDSSKNPSASQDNEDHVNELVRQYSALDDAESHDAKALSKRIFDATNYVVGPMPKRDSPKGSRKSSYFFDSYFGKEENDGKDFNSQVIVASTNDALQMTTVPKILSAEVAGQHISKGNDQHVRFVIRVKLQKQTASREKTKRKVKLSGDASILDGYDDEDDSVDHNDDDDEKEAADTSQGASPDAISLAITVQRRFSDFKELCSELQRSLGSNTALPALPKTAWLRKFSEDYIFKKRVALNAFLQKLLSAPWEGVPEPKTLADHPLVIGFLTRDSNIHLHEFNTGKAGAKVVESSQLVKGIHVSLETDPRPDSHKLEQNDSVGLANQDFKCVNCSRDLSIAQGSTKRALLRGFSRQPARTKRSARFCHYLEKWFCPGCFHTGISSDIAKRGRSSSSSSGETSSRDKGQESDISEESDEESHDVQQDFLRILPTRVLHKWDFDLFPVSHAAATFLDSIWEHPVLCVSASNPALFSQISQLQHARLLRVQMTLAREFVHDCAEWNGKNLQLESPLITDRRSFLHLAHDTELYSLSDLYELYLGNLIPQMIGAVDHFANHITHMCAICKSRGQTCNICKSSHPIYPFQIMVARQCPKCKMFIHRECFKSHSCK